MPVILVSSVSVTSGHETLRSMAVGGVKFGKKEPQAKSAAANHKPRLTPFKTAQANLNYASNSKKGKAKMVEPESDSESSSDNNDEEPTEATPFPATPVPAKLGQPRKDDLIAAVKKMKQA
ncbi:hypothetical protein PCANC_27353 [Puccinia coronata f. sp. avenae]|uniref:Uncharacterized protein n=1 Tax=Puccinia coronata f. sp. avenae TaxID=200324 RepID=A0A2N5TIR1_9BASI|nr:hypothetical protein PCANC_27353 [Puccinia coronata f. sp. avenae]